MLNKRKITIRNLRIIDGQTDNQDILRVFSDKFFNGFSQEASNVSEQQLINDIREMWANQRKMYLKISPHTIKRLSNKLNNGAGHDNFHPVLLKNGSSEFLICISKFINVCYSHCIFPPNLLKGDLNPTVKDLKGNITESANYRLVMQSSCLLKLVELHILSVLEEKVGFNSRQFGFVKGACTSDACFLLKETVHSYMKNKGFAFSVFIDLSKAFDMVDHCILGKKLIEKSVPVDIVLLIMCYLRNQSARVCWNGSSGEYYDINQGVRQGGILSPFLFKLYIDELLCDISDLEVGCRLGFIRLNIIGYADDLVLIADSVANLETMYNLLRQKILGLKLKLNINKSKGMIFEKGNIYKNMKEICMMGDVFEVVDNYKYLGHIIQRQLLDTDDVHFRLNSFYSKFNSVYRNFNSVSIETLLFLFNSYCVPDYGLSLWDTGVIFNKQIFKTFKVAYSNALKKIVGAPRYSSSHVTATLCNQLLLNHLVATLQWRYMKRLFKSFNSIISICKPYLKAGYLYTSTASLYDNVYGIDIDDGDSDVIRARVTWVQNHEPRRGICSFYGV